MNGMQARGVFEATLVAMAILVFGCGPGKEGEIELVGKSVSAFDFSSWQFVDLDSTSQEFDCYPCQRRQGCGNERDASLGRRPRALLVPNLR